MSVIIKYMDLPESCEKCQFCMGKEAHDEDDYSGWICVAMTHRFDDDRAIGFYEDEDGELHDFDVEKGRHQDCPLLEVKIGKWIRRHCISKNNKSIDMFVCSSCGEEFSWDAETGIKIDNYNICPNCGSYNRGVKSDDE